MKIAHSIFLILVFCICAAAQDPAATPVPTGPVVEEVFLAKDDGNGKAGDIVESFTTSDIPIYCVVKLNTSNPVAVKMNLVAVKVAGVKPESKVVTTSYTTTPRQNRVNFSGRPDGDWVAGSYRVDIFVDGKQEKSVTFQITNSAAPAGAMKFAPSKPKRPVKKN